jgi:hypothetical protein
MTQDEVTLFMKTQTALTLIYEEFKPLARRFPEHNTNKFKIKLINVPLVNANWLLGATFKPFDNFDIFIEDTPPSYSDLGFILAHYLNALENLREGHIVPVIPSNESFDRVCYARWYWKINSERSLIETSGPRNQSEEKWAKMMICKSNGNQ